MKGEAVGRFWNKERVNILTANWTTQSAAEIALELGTTRNTVIGKAHRLKLAPKRRRGRLPRARKPRTRTTPRSRPTGPLVAPEPIPAPSPIEGGVHILSLEGHHCRAIVGSGSDGLAVYCGAQKEGLIRTRAGRMLSSYCLDHGNQYYNRPDSV